MKISRVSFGALLTALLVTSAFADEGSLPQDDLAPVMMSKNGKLVPLPTPNPDTDASSLPPFVQENSEEWVRAKSLGILGGMQPASPPPPGSIVNYELPFDQRIPDCTYTGGYTFPEECDKDGEVVFLAGKDPQSVLDKITENRGIKNDNEHNIIPPDFTYSPPAFELVKPKDVPVVPEDE